MLSLQSYQAVQIIPTDTAIQNKLISEYFDQSTENEENEELFQLKSQRNRINRTSSQLDDVTDSIEFLEDILPKPGFFASLNAEKETFSLNELNDYIEKNNISTFVKRAQLFRKEVNQLREEKNSLEKELDYLRRWAPLDFNPKDLNAFKMTKALVGAIDTECFDELENRLSHFSEIYLETLHYSEEEILLLVIVSAEEAHDVEQTLIHHRFEQISYEYDQLPSEELKRIKQRVATVEQQIEELKEHREEHNQLLHDLRLAEEYIYILRERQKAREEVLELEEEQKWILLTEKKIGRLLKK